MDYRLERIRDHAVAHLYPPSEAGNLIAHVQAHVDEVVTVDDAEMIATVRWLFHEARVVAEPSGAAAVAAALRAGVPGAVAVVSGGNVDPEAFAAYIAS